ncbi:MAG: class I SAM-dependent methyltransferase [Chlorobiaceae bacterium]|nr:class I SAM-dependent methyltransferase [Chlorobiaceae bacterium]
MTDNPWINTERFDNKAAGWDSNLLRAALADAVSRAMIAHLPVTKPQNALEFGCGTGLVTRRIAPHCSSLTAADSSSQMLMVLNEKIAAEAIPNIKPVLIDISRPEAVPEIGEGFDFVCSSMTLHHISDTPGFLRQIYGVMSPGGTLSIADLDAEDGFFHDDETEKVHHGFDRMRLETTIESAGFAHVSFMTAHIIEKKNREGRLASYPVFLVTAVKSLP